jgi:hypothetical protein
VFEDQCRECGKDNEGWTSVTKGRGKGKSILKLGSGNGGANGIRTKAMEKTEVKEQARSRGPAQNMVKFPKSKDKIGGQNLGKLDKVTTEHVDENWEVIRVTLDSGATDHVIDEETGKQFGMQETATSRRGGYYRAANNTKIMNMGERKIAGYTTEGRKAGMVFQVCGVNGPLGSARRICREKIGSCWTKMGVTLKIRSQV